MTGRIRALGERLRGNKAPGDWADLQPVPSERHPTPEAERTIPTADAPDWDELGAVRPVPGGPVELPDSRAEPGGVPVRVDPAMVNPETAERMKPKLD